VAEALERSPEVRAAEALLAEAVARPVQIEALPEPLLSVLYTNEGWAPTLGQNEFTTLGFLWTQELPGRGKRALRRDVLRRDADLAGQQVVRVRLAVAAEVRRAYHELVHARELLTLLEEQERLSDAVATAARARYVSGQGSQADLLRAQVERLRLAQRRASRIADEAVQIAALNQSLARPSGTPISTAGHRALAPVMGSLDALLVEAEAGSPELRAARLVQERERSAQELARRNGSVDWSVQAGYQNRGGLPGMWQAGFGVRMPLWRQKVKAGIAEAEARVRASEERLAATRLILRLRTEERLARARALEETAVLFRDGLLPQDRLAYESALLAYQAGRGTFAAVLESAAALFRDREAELRIQADHQILLAALAEASLEPTATMGDPRP